MDKVIWIAWERHRRTEQIVKFLGIKAYLFESKMPRVIKHPLFLIRTFTVLFKNNPKVLIVQNPSLILSGFACFLKVIKMFSFRLIIDAHNAGVVSPRKGVIILERFFVFLHKTADLTIVTNLYLSETIKKSGGASFILSDKIPEIEKVEDRSLKGKFNFVCICTFSIDEPYREIIEAALSLSPEDMLYVTGNFRNAPPEFLSGLPNNIVLTGYLEEPEYWSYLKCADCIIDLTFRDNCLVCGAYEAVSVGTPVILSDRKILREIFYKGAIFTENDSESMKIAMQEVKSHWQELSYEINVFRDEYIRTWEKRGDALRDEIKRMVR